MYETFEHTADLGLRMRAGDLETLFADAARGLLSMIVPELETVRPTEERHFEIAGQERDYLLFDWLNELLYVFDTEHMLFSEFDVRFTPKGISVTARGEPLDPSRHELDHEVKAITYHGLRLEQQKGQWTAEVIVDI
jgi:SHS2 domain-containing protein